MKYLEIDADKLRVTPDQDVVADYILFAIKRGAHESLPGKPLIDVETLSDGSAGLVICGTAPVMERREQLLMLYDGIKTLASRFKDKENA